MDERDDEDCLEMMAATARMAGDVALRLRSLGVASETKADASPVTRADREAEEVILRALGESCPAVPVVAEEAHAAGRVPATLGDAFFLVDPIDGTREFIAGRAEFTVNIALVRGRVPSLGVVFAPALGLLYAGSPGGATLSEDGRAPRLIRVCGAGEPITALASRSHRTAETDAFLARHGIGDVASVGSSLKFCRLAEGAAHLYPCFGTTMEWDTAAGQAVLEAAGGRVVEPDGAPLLYGKRGRAGVPDFRNPSFVALGAMALPT